MINIFLFSDANIKIINNICNILDYLSKAPNVLELSKITLIINTYAINNNITRMAIKNGPLIA